MARSFPSCLLSFTYCFSRFILDFFFANILHLSFLVCSSPLWFFFCIVACLEYVFVYVWKGARKRRRRRSCPLWAQEKFFVWHLKLVFMFHQTFFFFFIIGYFPSLFSSRRTIVFMCMLIIKKKDCSFVLTRHICV